MLYILIYQSFKTKRTSFITPFTIERFGKVITFPLLRGTLKFDC